MPSGSSSYKRMGLLAGLDSGEQAEEKKAKPPSPVRGGATTITVGQAAGMIRQALADHVPGRVRVAGQVSNFSGGSHLFFSLKDEEATLRCVCFASNARRIRFSIEDGMEVIATGRLDFYGPQGQVQLYVDRIEPVGLGELERQFRLLCDELREQGYFDPGRKKRPPTMPQRVAVVTSRQAAALQDVIHTASQRWAGCQLLLFNVRVQGDGAAGEIARALDLLGKHGPRLGIEAIILTRGGGSMEDLWAFNERAVADAVFRCPLPIVAAIGHETDTTIAELVADVRCATPTQAAMWVVPDAEALRQQVDQLGHRLSLLIKRTLHHNRQWLDAVSRHPIFRRPQATYEPLRQRLDQFERRMHTAMSQRLQRASHQVAALARQMQAVNPNRVLQRGYTYTLGPDGHVLRQAKDVQAGDAITTVLADGRVRSVVEKDEQGAGKDKASKTKRPETKKKKGAK